MLKIKTPFSIGMGTTTTNGDYWGKGEGKTHT